MSKFKLGAWFHRAGKLLRGRTFTAAGLAVAVGLSLWAVAENVKILYIADGAETGVTLALRSDPTEQALSRAGITLKEMIPLPPGRPPWFTAGSASAAEFRLHWWPMAARPPAP